MCDRREVKRHPDIGGRNLCSQMLQQYCPGHVDPIGRLDMPTVRHEMKSNYMLCLVALVEHAETVRSLMGLEARCLDRPYDQYFSIRDEDAWSGRLHFELR